MPAMIYLAVTPAHLYYWEMGLRGDEVSPARTGALVALLAARVVLYEAVAALDCAGFSKFLYLLVPFQAYFSLGKRAGYALGVLYLGVLVARFSAEDPLWYRQDRYVSVLLIYVVGLAFVVVMARALQDEARSRARAERLLDDLAASHARLRASAERVAELAAAEERNRLARDIHDSLGHHLTAITIQLEKALAFRERDPPEADRAVQDARQSAQAALTDVRRSVAAPRGAGEPFSLRTALHAPVEQAGDARFTIDLRIDGTGFDPAILKSLPSDRYGLRASASGWR